MKNLNRFYVYRAILDGVLLYIGKGSGDRIDSTKNKWFNLFNKYLEFERIKCVEFLTEQEAFNEEGRLIKKYGKPIFNLVQGQEPKLWEEAQAATINDMHEMIKNHAKGEDSPTPLEVSFRMCKAAGKLKPDAKVLLPEDRYGVLMTTILILNLDFKGTITTIEQNPDRMRELGLVRKRTNYCITIIMTDFLEHDFEGEAFDCIIMNPPFTASGMRMIVKAKEHLNEEGVLASVAGGGFWKVRTGGCAGDPMYRRRKAAPAYAALRNGLLSMYAVSYKEASRVLEIGGGALIVVYKKGYVGPTKIENSIDKRIFVRDLSKYKITPPFYEGFDALFDGNQELCVNQGVSEAAYENLRVKHPAVHARFIEMQRTQVPIVGSDLSDCYVNLYARMCNGLTAMPFKGIVND